ncbi:MAG: acyl-CoA desaturase [Bacteroidia bacterium]
MTTRIKFNNSKQKDFYATLKTRVDDYFTASGKSKNANGHMIFKTIFILSVTVGSYLLLILANYSLPVMFLLWSVLGIFTAFIGLNICHDAIHGAYSKNEKVNKYLGLLFNLIGANAYNWNIMHNVVHHSFTNIEGHDEDIQSVPILRMSPHQELWKIHRYQHIYVFALYALASLSWVFSKDYVKFFKAKIGNYDNRHRPRKEYYNLFGFKLLYYALYIAVPLLVIDFAWWQILLGFLVMHVFEGLTLAIVFALAHVVEGTDFPLPDEKGRIENSWAVHQMYTTANFANNSFLATFFCGGLNFQIEHHLFPRICHVHYKDLSRIVENTAKEFGLPYIHNPSFLGAIGSHTRFLRELGRKEHLVAPQVETRLSA